MIPKELINELPTKMVELSGKFGELSGKYEEIEKILKSREGQEYNPG